MKFKVKREKLLEALQKVTSIIGSRNTLAVLSNVLFEAQGEKLHLTTSDLEIRITTRIDAEIEREGKTTIPGKRLLSVVSKFKGDVINFECNENHHTEMNCGTASFRLLGLADDDFPLPATFIPIRKIQLPESELSKIIDQISYAVSIEDARKVLLGMFFSLRENTFTAVATDGKRLALVEKIVEDFSGEEGDCVIPRKSAIELKRLLGSKGGVVSISIGENQILFETTDSTMTSKLIEGNYPNYRQVIPASFQYSVEISTDDFISTLELVSIAISDLTSSFVRLTFADNSLLFSASSTEVGESKDHLAIDYSGDEISISFNPTFIGDPFRHSHSDRVNVKLNDNFSPVGIEGTDGFLYVIMPMRNK